MIVTLSEALKADKTLIDEQIATAFLSGIVAATERFSNNRTSARVMTMAAQLMSAGANQQLIASKFEEAVDESGESHLVEVAPAEAENLIPTEDNAPPEDMDETSNSDGTTNLSEGESTKVEREDTPSDEQVTPEEPEQTENGTLNIAHEMEGTLDEVAKQKAQEDQAEAVKAAEEAASVAKPAEIAEQELSDTLPPVVVPAVADISPADLQEDIQSANAAVEAAAEVPQLQGAVSADVWKNADGPIYGGILNATTEAAAEESRRIEQDDRNKTILNHDGGYIADQVPTYTAPLNAASQPPQEQAMVNPLSSPDQVSQQAAPIQPLAPTLSEIDEQSRAVDPIGLPPLPDFSTLPPLPPLPPPLSAPAASPATDKLGDILPPAEQAPQEAVANDPGQFRIPGQS